MPDEFFKFPRTPHLFCSPREAVRGDHVFSEAEREAFLSGEILIEEKMDGANVGVSVTEGVIRAQNRGSYIQPPSDPQFQPLWSWLAERAPELTNTLEAGLVVFGEWCFAVHSVRYNRLPDWFLGFDVYDTKAKRFWSSDRRDPLLKSLGIQSVRKIDKGRFDVERLRRLLISTTSAYGDQPVEGLYLRRESPGWVESRAKMVNPAFSQAIEQHWSSRPLERNSVTRPVWQSS